MSFGWNDEPAPAKPRRTKQRLQAQTFERDGVMYRVAFVIAGTAICYPVSDVALKPDASNMLKLPEAEAWRLVG